MIVRIIFRQIYAGQLTLIIVIADNSNYTLEYNGQEMLKRHRLYETLYNKFLLF